ncbi:hypothetical protein C1645_806499 [Glomus cerebriforme]|uniref:AIG1-type G domain-containing protein n=1 Tax=Glomus cerebriforme TaxID=658196 RepID=A0A397SYU9_9GLOM|nr:hypothetical protein C1645_806499 [Glomus cerebriforme]
MKDIRRKSNLTGPLKFMKLRKHSFNVKGIKNLVVVGRAGCGKSALCNVLADTDEFKESELSVSETSNLTNFQKKSFEWNGKKYCVVDTVGIGNTELPTEIILDRISKEISKGRSEVLFVINERFSVEEIKAFKLFKDSGIFEDITIVKTKFANFKDKEECKKDKNQLCENGIFARIINTSRSIVYVDNPSINIKKYDDDYNDDDEEDRTGPGLCVVQLDRKDHLSYILVLLIGL